MLYNNILSNQSRYLLPVPCLRSRSEANFEELFEILRRGW